ncbi:MAG: hypothetical protein H7062_11510 [Candidatus Saccharimonas sp.]|nr:hypothetical protein [Planctomycetaceae bacterium]
MNDQHDAIDTKLDDLLRNWADDSSDEADDSSGEVRLLRAIMAAAPRRGPEVTPTRGAWSTLVACAAAVILLAVSSVIPLSPSAVTRTTALDSSVASQAGLSELWSRTADMFGPQLNWLCDLDGELLLGVDEGAATIPEQDRAFVLLTVRVRDTRSGEWSAIWTGRVVCPLGESVDFVSDKTHSGGTIWVQSRPNGRLVASHWLNWSEHPEISGAVDAEVSSGETRVVAEQSIDGRSIQVVQQVWMPHAG